MLARYYRATQYRAVSWWYRLITSRYQFPGGYKRIYFYHIRKAGGTSINHMFLGLSGRDGAEVYRRIGDTYRITENGKVYVGWTKPLIEGGHYYYAFSHIPAHELVLPCNTFTFTCLRDPVARIVSHYRMLLEHLASPRPHVSFQEERHWLGSNLAETVDKMPREHLLRHLYMFSKTFDVDEAFERITQCQAVLFLEELHSGIEKLNDLLGIQLEYRHSRKSVAPFTPDENTEKYLAEVLEPEIRLYKRVHEYVSHQAT